MKLSRIKIPLELLDSLRQQPLSDEIKAHIIEAAELIPDEENWMVVKKILLLSFAPADRQLFTRRDDRTRLQQPFNSFEKQVRIFWRQLTGKTLIMPEEKKMINTTIEDYL